MATNFPYEFRFLQGDLAKRFPMVTEKMVFVGPKRYCLPKKFEEVAERFYNFKSRPSDVWLFGFPRSGTTMAQEMVWLIGNDLDYERAAQDVLDFRFLGCDKDITHYLRDLYAHVLKEPHKYKDYLLPIAEKLIEPHWVSLERRTDRRFIKTHLPFSLASRDVLESGCKIFYCARNPKDVIVSNFELFTRAYEKLSRDMSVDQYWEEFKCGLIMWTSYFEHLKEAWLAAKLHPNNVMILFYEDYKKDARKTLVRIATFLDKTLTEEDLDKLEDHLRINNFRKNQTVNKDYFRDLGLLKDKPDSFIRSGAVGGWKDRFSDTISKEIDQWIEENLKHPEFADFEFTYL